MKTLSVFLILIISAAPLTAQPRFSTSDLHSVVKLSEVELSPDGKRALVLVTKQTYESNSTTHELVLLDTATKQQILLPHPGGVFELLWSPDGKAISYLAEKDGITQIFFAPLEHPSRFRQVTSVAAGVYHHSWSPDGKWFAFLAAQKASGNRFNDAFEVGSNDFLTGDPAAANYVGRIKIVGGGAEKLSPEGYVLGTDFYASSLSWTPDGKRIAITRYPASRSGDSDLGRNLLLDVNSKEIIEITDHNDRETPARLSPDGKRAAFLYPREGIPANVTELYATSLPEPASKSLTRSLDRDITDFAWMRDGRLLVTGCDGPQSALWISDDAGGWTSLDLGEVKEIAEFSISKTGSIAFIGDETYRPSEVYLKATPQSPPVRLTEFNQSIASLPQAKRERFQWTSDTFTADGVLTYPLAFDPNRKYPLVLLIHGGPTATSTLAFYSTAQLMAARGWIVFEPNYRGSNDLGNAYQSAIADDAGEGPGRDVMNGVEELKKKPFVDSAKIAVSGWSYGGWMTAWMIGRYPGEWAAAVAGAAPVDYTDMYSLSDLNRTRRHAITDSPYVSDHLQKAWDQSPIKNFARIKTPTLVLSKTQDSRVAITGSYKLFNALRDNGIPTQFIAYPGRGHLVTDPVRSKDVYDRWLAWLERYLTP